MSLDDETFAELWRTSSPVARARYRREVLQERPVYGEPRRTSDNRAYWLQCGNPSCGGWFKFLAEVGGHPVRYCSEGCAKSARYWRNRERVLARSRADRVRKKEAA